MTADDRFLGIHGVSDRLENENTVVRFLVVTLHLMAVC